MEKLIEVYRVSCQKHKTLLNYILWGLIIVYTLTGIGLRIAKYDVEYFIFCLLVLVSFLVLLGVRIQNKKSWLLITSLVCFIAIFNVFSAFANTGANRFLDMVFNGSLRIVGYILAAMAIHETSDGKTMKRILPALVITATLQSVLSIISVAFTGNVLSVFSVPTGTEPGMHYEARGFFSDPRMFSVLLTFTLLITMFLYWLRVKELYQVKKSLSVLLDKYLLLCLLGAALQIGALALSGAYTSLIILLVGIILFSLLLARVKLRYFVICLCLLGVVVIAVPFLRNTVIEDLQIKGTIQGFQFTDKDVYACLDTGYHNPVTGVGNGNYTRTIINLDKGMYPYTPFSASTNVPNSSVLLHFAENGLFSVLGYMALILVLIYFGLRKLIYARALDQDTGVLSLIVMILILLVLFLLTSQLLYEASLMLLLFVLIIPNIVGSDPIPHNNNNIKPIRRFKRFYIVLCTLIGVVVILIGIWFVRNDNLYGPRMESQRIKLYNQIQTMKLNIRDDLTDMVYSHMIDKETYLSYLDVLDQYTTLTEGFVNEKNSRFYKCRSLKDLYAHLSDLYSLSDQLTTGSAKAFFELTMPVHISNYSADHVFLPMYSYTGHYFDQISGIRLNYYIDSGFNFSPLQAIRAANDDYLLTGQYDKFKQIFEQMEGMLDVKTYNGEDYLCAAYYFKYRDYMPPWYSGMAQGVLLETTALAYKLTGDQYYYDFAQKIIPAFYIDYKDGGVMYEDKEYGLPFILEYTNTENDRELNGCIIGAIGLREWYRVSGDEKVLKLYRDIMQDVIYRLDDYDFPMEGLPEGASATKYSLTVYPAQKGYHGLHINLLSALSRDTLISDLKDFDKIEYYLNRWLKSYEYMYPDEDVGYLLDDHGEDTIGEQ